MMIRSYREGDLEQIVGIWNGCVERKEVLYRPLKKAYFEEKFLGNPGVKLICQK